MSSLRLVCADSGCCQLQQGPSGKGLAEKPCSPWIAWFLLAQILWTVCLDGTEDKVSPPMQLAAAYLFPCTKRLLTTGHCMACCLWSPTVMAWMDFQPSGTMNEKSDPLRPPQTMNEISDLPKLALGIGSCFGKFLQAGQEWFVLCACYFAVIFCVHNCFGALLGLHFRCTHVYQHLDHFDCILFNS